MSLRFTTQDKDVKEFYNNDTELRQAITITDFAFMLAKYRIEPQNGETFQERRQIILREVKQKVGEQVRERQLKAEEIREKDENIITDIDKITDLLRIREQCFLVESMRNIVPFNFDTPYKNITPIHDKSDTIVNRVAGPVLLEPLWSIKPDQLARMQPLIRIFKVFYDSNGKDEESVEMPFDEFINVNNLASITNQGTSRGAGAGLVGFEWKMQGSNPAEARSLIEVKMTLRFNNIDDLARKKTVRTSSGAMRDVSFLDLWSMTPRKNNPCMDSELYDVNGFRFKALVGWSPVDGLFEPSRRKDGADLNKVIKEDQKLLTLNVTTHSIDFQQEGPIDVIVEAKASIDAIAWSEKSNVFRKFLENSSIAINEEEIKNMTASQKAECQTVKDESEAINKKRKEKVEELEKDITNQKTIVWRGFMQELAKMDRVWAISVSNEYLGFTYNSKNKLGVRNTLDDFQPRLNTNPYKYDGNVKLTVPTGDDNRKSMQVVEENLQKAAQRSVDNAKAGLDKQAMIPFIFLGDLLELALESLKNDYNEEDNIRTLIGDVVYFDPYDKKRYSVNLADMPVSFRMFQNWFLENVYAKQRVVYPVKDFITDLVKDIVVEMFKPGVCFTETARRRIRTSFNTFTLHTLQDGSDPINPENKTRLTADEVRANRKKTSKAEKSESKKYIQYMMIYTSDIVPNKLVADYERDLKSGIPWFFIGRDRGLIESIKFSKTDIPFMQESRIIQGATEFARLRERYQAAIEMKGNNFFFPGQIIYINPSTMLGSNGKSNEIARMIGLVGYYQIIDVNSVIGPGEFTTSLNALWVAAGDGALAVPPKNCDPCKDDKFESKSKNVSEDIVYEDYVLSPQNEDFEKYRNRPSFSISRSSGEQER